MKKQTKFEKMMDYLYDRKFFCFLGWHTWTWNLPKDGILILDAPPPDHAECRHCRKRYKSLNQGTEK